MLIIWGTRRTERTLGYVADFCPICHELSAFRLIRLGRASHLYYISIGSGKYVGQIIRCEECGVDLDTDPTRYLTIEKQRPAHLSELVQATFPTLTTFYASQLAREAEIRQTARTLPPAERTALLIEPFQLLHGLVEARYAGGTKMDKPAGIGCLATTVLSVGILVGGSYFTGTLSDNVLLAFAIVFCVGALYTFIQTGLAPGRFLRARILPQLARALAPLQPDESELTECLKRCRAIGWKIGSKIKPRKILAEIEHRRTEALEAR